MTMGAKRLAIGLAAVAGLIGALACSVPGEEESGSDAGPQPVISTSTGAVEGVVTAFADGVYVVGTGDGQVAAGQYRATVPTDSVGCYWARLKGTGGTADEIIANGLGRAGAPVVVTIAATDKAFETRGCGTWSAG